MSKYGNKFTCWSCGTKFYDLNKPNRVCPKCGADPGQDPNLGRLPSADELGGYGEEFEEEIEEEAPLEDEEESEGDLDEGGEEDEEF